MGGFREVSGRFREDFGKVSGRFLGGFGEVSGRFRKGFGKISGGGGGSRLTVERSVLGEKTQSRLTCRKNAVKYSVFAKN